MYWNNVETQPGTGYPRNWMEAGGGFDENGNLKDGNRCRIMVLDYGGAMGLQPRGAIRKCR